MSEACEMILISKPTERVMLLTIKNPPLNLITREIAARLKQICSALRKDREIRAVVIAGAGDRAFSAGADVKEFPEVWDDVIGKKLQQENEAYDAIEQLPQPVIAAVNGIAYGGGCELAMACDLRVMARNGKMALPEINLGVFPGSGGLFRLPKLVGSAKAMELMFLGESLTAEECLAAGLVNRLALDNEAVNEAVLMAKKIAEKPCEAIRLIKKGVRETGGIPNEQCFYKNLEFSRGIFQTADCIEGVDAFLHKRKPWFQ